MTPAEVAATHPVAVAKDWGTGWTEFHGEGAPSQEILLTFCQQFYFGE